MAFVVHLLTLVGTLCLHIRIFRAGKLWSMRGKVGRREKLGRDGRHNERGLEEIRQEWYKCGLICLMSSFYCDSNCVQGIHTASTQLSTITTHVHVHLNPIRIYQRHIRSHRVWVHALHQVRLVGWVHTRTPCRQMAIGLLLVCRIYLIGSSLHQS